MEKPSINEDFLAVARVVRPQGRKGEVIAEILTDFPERFQNARNLYIEIPGNQAQPITLENAWMQKGRVVLKLSGIDSIEEASHLRGSLLMIPRQDRAAPTAHSYYIADLKGCRVLRAQRGAGSAPIEVGVVTDVDTESAEVSLLCVADAGNNDRQILIPLVDSICTQIDIESKTILIEPPEDLLELNP